MGKKRRRKAAKRSAEASPRNGEAFGGPDAAREAFISTMGELRAAVDDPSPWPTREQLSGGTYDQAFAAALEAAQHSLVLAYLEDYENEELPGHIYLGTNGEAVVQSEREFLYGHLEKWGAQGRCPQVCRVCGGPFAGGPGILYPLSKYKVVGVLNAVSEVPDAVVGSEVQNWATKVCSPRCWAYASPVHAW